MRVKGKALSVKLIVFLLLLLSPFPFTLSPVQAADSTPSADIRSKLEELKRDIASKAAKLKADVNRKLTNKAYVGHIKTKSDISLTLASNSGPKSVAINQDTSFESQIKKRLKVSLNSLAQEDYVATLGDVDETKVLTAKKIILLQPVTSNLKTFLWGQIVSISDKLLTVKDGQLKNIAVTVPSETKIKLNDFIIATGKYNKNDIFETEFVYVIPQGGIIKPARPAVSADRQAGGPKKMATPSATPR